MSTRENIRLIARTPFTITNHRSPWHPEEETLTVLGSLCMDFLGKKNLTV